MTNQEQGDDLIELVSAGGVVHRHNGSDLEIVICGFDSASDGIMWRLPKGTPEHGETHQQTALREVSEETGLQVAIDDFLGSTEYSFNRFTDGASCHKIVHFYLMSANGGDISLHDHEFDYVKWLPAAHALSALTYQNEVKVVENAISLVSKKARTR